eukprot:scaffold132498_cov42-Phaeocystis_antarctica.AAC.1
MHQGRSTGRGMWLARLQHSPTLTVPSFSESERALELAFKAVGRVARGRRDGRASSEARSHGVR